MYVKNVKELIAYILDVFRERRFLFSVKYLFWVVLDKLRGVDYVKNEGYDKLGTVPEQSSVFQATRDMKYLYIVLDSLNITAEDAILDLGCGKGYLLKKFSEKYPFHFVGGVELSSRLCEIATENLTKEKISNFRIYHANAACFREFDGYTYIYMFNPFPAAVMKEVMKNLHGYLSLHADRKMTIIYRNPVCHDDIVSTGDFSLKRVFRGKTSNYNVYCNQ